MLSRAMISGILNLISNTSLGTQSGGTTGTLTHSAAAQAISARQGTSADLQATQTVKTLHDATSSLQTEVATHSGGSFGSAASPPKTTYDLAPPAPQTADAQAVEEKLRSAMAQRAFTQTASREGYDSEPITPLPETHAEPARRARTASAARPSLVLQERMIRADLAAELTRMAQTRDIGPADALRIMAGHNPQFPLEDPAH